MIGPDTYAIFDDKAREVYFEKHLSASKTVGCKKPDGYAIPTGFMVVEAPQRWPAPSANWIV